MADETIRDLEEQLQDGHPAVRGGWVTVPPRFSEKLGITVPGWEGEIRDIVRFEGRVLLTVYEPRTGHLRATSTEHARSRKPPGKGTKKRARASLTRGQRPNRRRKAT